ncbi:MAG: type II toxin-antitoxin system prevent-host-death family antitoxin [Vicinamibacterales bacterium]
MVAVGIREFKNNVSEHVRRVEKGESVAVTSHGRIVAELVPPGNGSKGRRRRSRYDELVANGVIRPALESGDPLPDDGVRIRLRAGSVQEMIDWDREDKY